ncbi:hypothetical protein AJ78_02084 [Emergomyces pasteurianus Ep9510]|uniref:Uncharacterized protein n=1 Tax=Emergomyces pasteurianus Ep9510 TaxID=1447872 RepID=A0A1J9QC70_9EURO|nr:hypothetical protein AJ78_02084 [Emergomyces pasteurianus Ep9510]
MSSRHAGRQSPSPSRQTGPQESDIPGWTGKAEQTALDGHGPDAEQPMRNLASSERASGPARGVPGATVDSEGNVRLQSNPVHALEAESETKTAKKGVVGMK